MERAKLLYIMGIDWNWIYQRPQILAEKLAQDFEVTAVFPKSIIKVGEKVRDSEKKGLTLRILWTLPYQEKNVLIGKLSRWFNRKVFKDIYEFDYIYIGFPQYARYIPQDYQGRIIYDCLDNFEKLYPDRKRSYKVTQQELPLIKRCDRLLASSQYLKEKVDAVAGYDKAFVLRNATKLQDKPAPIKAPVQKVSYKLGYIGTISEWMDYDLLIKSFAQVEGIQYHMLGPVVKSVEFEGIHYEGIVAHEKLQEAIVNYDCLIMPFLVNEIILAVDPVKLYEYISFGKCIISVYYPEVERFRDFVYFYHSYEEYVELLKELKSKGFPAKYTAEKQKFFLQENTWDKRYESLKEIICG